MKTSYIGDTNPDAALFEPFDFDDEPTLPNWERTNLDGRLSRPYMLFTDGVSSSDSPWQGEGL